MSPDPGLKSKVSGKLSAVTKRADMLGALVGYLGTFAMLSKAENYSFTQTLVGRHINAVKVHNLQKLSDVPFRIVQDPNWSTFTLGGIGVGIIGAIASYLPSVVPWQGTIANLAKKVGFGAAVGGLLATLVGTVAEGSGGSVVEGGGSSSNPSSVSSTGRMSRPTGAFAPPTPYVGTWARPR